MSLNFEEDVWMFLSLAQKHQVRMLMVGGGAVNFYGYQRHSADVDFWIDTPPSNLTALRDALNELGYEFDDLINSKIKAGRPKDLYDIIELRKIQENKN